MVNFTDFNRIATAAIGSLVISTAFIAAAIAPAAGAGSAPAPTYAAAVQSPAATQADA